MKRTIHNSYSFPPLQYGYHICGPTVNFRKKQVGVTLNVTNKAVRIINRKFEGQHLHFILFIILYFKVDIRIVEKKKNYMAIVVEN